MKTSNVTAAVVAATMVCASAVGLAAGEQKGAASKGTTSFQKVDTDANGAISMDEARAVPGLADNFTKADKNGDGQLSKSEYESAMKGQNKAKKSAQ